MQMRTRKNAKRKRQWGRTRRKTAEDERVGEGGRSVREDLRFRNGTRENESRGAHEGSDSFRN